ncbi:MAG: dNTP triphosphohydrolase [Bacteroidales bacterium]|nr:dNTP triphosphohydrolase [Anaerotignum sp.]MCI5679686.1 dNTP triphosphohydrolase [Bacteroidales bacterium]MDY3925729.1 dNTP triphosphohydrolase [Anaerotignum sp.]
MRQKTIQLSDDDMKLCREYLEELHKPSMSVRFNKEDATDRSEGEYHRDYTRIMYSSSFRRLQGKMQLLGLENSAFYRNRLTHSLEVAQIARSIAADLDYKSYESFVVEAGALAHDIGNAPFGHAGERFLNEIYKDIGGFEGNAQTLRILTKIERKRPEFRGLNLTPRTQLSVIKYFSLAEDGKYHPNNKFIYRDNYEEILAFTKELGIHLRTLDVQIVDLADEIAYAAHDLEDGLRVKAFTIDDVLQEYWNKCLDKKKSLSKESFYLFEKLVENARKKSGYRGNDKLTSSEYLHLFGMELASKVINNAISGIGMVDVTDEFRQKTNTERDKELGFLNPDIKDMVGGLKDIVFECINHNNKVYHYEQEGRKVIEFLSEFYKDKNEKYLPPEYRASEWPEYGIPKAQERLTCDYIAGMMDSYAIEQYEKYSGEKFRG